MFYVILYTKSKIRICRLQKDEKNIFFLQNKNPYLKRRTTFDVRLRNVVWNRKIFQTRYTWTLCFCSEIENKTHIVNIAWWLRFKYMRIMQSIFSKSHPKKIKGEGGGAVSVLLEPPLIIQHYFLMKTIGITHDKNMLAVYERNSWISI